MPPARKDGQGGILGERRKSGGFVCSFVNKQNLLAFFVKKDYINSAATPVLRVS